MHAHCSVLPATIGRSLPILFSLGLLLAPRFAAAEWSQFQGNAGHTGYAPSCCLPTQTTPNWTVRTVAFKDPTPAYRFTPGVASDGDKLFVSWLGHPSTINGVSALNIATGSELWEWTYQGNDSEDISAPAYDNGRLYVHRWGHSSSCGIGCHDKPRLLGMNTTMGAQIFDQTHSGQWSSGGRPAALDGQVYVAGGYYGGLDNYDGATGQIEWFAGMPQEYGWIPAAHGDKVFTSFSGHLTVVNKSTGAQQTLLAPSGGGYGSSTPVVVSANEAYVPSGNLITQFDPANKYATWEYKVGNQWLANQGLAIGGDALYANFGSVLKAIDRETGLLLWEWTAPVQLSSNVIATNTHLFVGNNDTTYAIGLDSRSVEWSAAYGGELAVAGGHLIVSNSSAVHAFALVPEPTVLAMGSVLTTGMVMLLRRRNYLSRRCR